MNGYQEKSTHFHRWKILFLFCPCIWWYNLRIEICKRNSGKKYTGCGFLGGIRTWSLLKHFVNIRLNLVYFLDCGWKKISATTSVKLSQRVKSKGGVGCNTEFTCSISCLELLMVFHLYKKLSFGPLEICYLHEFIKPPSEFFQIRPL